MRKTTILFLAVLVLWSCRDTDRKHQKSGPSETSGQAAAAPVREIRIADLPDSLQPKKTWLKDHKPTQTVTIPKQKGGFYWSKTAVIGEEKKVALEPPRRFPLQTLQNEAGETILGRDGRPFILGDGGIADMTTFSSEDGLALDFVVSSCMDHLGNLWFGTVGGGVSRFDGKFFTNFTTAHGLVNDNVIDIKEDRSGNIWMATYGGGVSRYDGKSFTNYTTAEGLANDQVWCIEEDRKGNLWFGTFGGGVSRFNPANRTFTNFTTEQGINNQRVQCIREDKQGHIWMGSIGGGVYQYDPATGGVTNYSTTDGLVSNNIRCIEEDRSGHLWFGSEGAGVSRFDPATSKFTTFAKAQGLASNRLWDIKEDKSGNLWFGTEDGGVSRYDPLKDQFTTYTKAQGLPLDQVWDIEEDNSGNLWFSTNGGGVCRYKGKSFSYLTEAQGIGNGLIASIFQDKSGDIWFSTHGAGLCRYDGTSFTNFTTAQGLSNNYVRAIEEDRNGNLWISTYAGLNRFEPANGKIVRYTTDQGLPSDIIRSLEIDESENIWIGTEDRGVIMYDPGEGSFTNYTTSQGLPHHFVAAIRQDRSGNLWFGTSGGGVCRFDPVKKSMTNFTDKNGLPDNNVWCITEDSDSNIWFGTFNGMSLYNTRNHQFTNFTTEQGLPNNVVAQIVEGNKGQIYVGTFNGVCELTGKGSDWTVKRIFNTATGYPVKDLNTGKDAMFKDKQGLIWMGTGYAKTALVRFDPRELPKNSRLPTVMIQKVKVDGNDIGWYDLAISTDSTTLAQQEMMTYGKVLAKPARDSLRRKYADIRFDSITPFYPVPVHLVLPYRHNSLSFDFAAIETGANASVRYQFFLEGYDREWSPVSGNTTAVFGNIREGQYTFMLKVQSPEGIWSEPVTYTFEVLPPWWRTWWAYSLYLVTFLFLLRVFTLWRERNLRAEKEKLEKTVEIRTAEVVAEKKKSDDLLLNILPAEVAEELKAKGNAEAKQYDEVTVMFTDFKDFTQISEKLSPAELVSEIDACFSAFDEIIDRHHIEKIKTIGDSYMCAGGLPVANKTHATDIVGAALEIQQFMQRRNRDKNTHFEIRIGIHTGPVVAGIVGIKKFAYDIWGDTVNTASRMESSGEPGKINVSGTTYDLVKDQYKCRYRGKIEAKNKGHIDMYFVEAVI